MWNNINREKKAVIGIALIKKIVKRLIELEAEYWENSNRNDPPVKDFLYGKSDGLAKALEVIDGFLNFEPEIHKLIDDSKKWK